MLQNPDYKIQMFLVIDKYPGKYQNFNPLREMMKSFQNFLKF